MMIRDPAGELIATGANSVDRGNRYDRGMVEPVCITIADSDAQSRARAEALAESLGLVIVPHDAEPTQRLLLHVSARALELAPADSDEPGLRIDLAKCARQYSRGNGPGRSHPLGKAIGKTTRSIIDATAGVGQDAILLATMGCEVRAIERSAVLHAMLSEALHRAKQDAASDAAMHRGIAAVLERVSFEFGDAAKLLPDCPAADAIYIDPMFPPKRNESALPRKAVRVIRALVGEDDDAGTLLEAARQSRTRRVVMKRPDHVPPLMEDTVARFTGKLVRYDVYVD